ncbi:MAG: hypothetical protein ACRDKJ_00885, partial [Actinomycetota bacterium]
VDVVVPKAAQITGVLEREGAEVARAKAVVEAGERRISIPLSGEGFPRRATYAVRVEAYDGTTTVNETLDVVLTRPANNLWLRVVIATLIAIALFLGLRRRAHVRRVRRQGRATSELLRRRPSQSQERDG